LLTTWALGIIIGGKFNLRNPVTSQRYAATVADYFNQAATVWKN
jgi:hypothetical protein